MLKISKERYLSREWLYVSQNDFLTGKFEINEEVCNIQDLSLPYEKEKEKEFLKKIIL